MGRLTKTIKSVRGKLFFTLCVIVLSIILFLIIVNSFVLEKYYQYAKSNQLKIVHKMINSYFNGEIQINNLEDELDKISIKNNFDIIIKNREDVAVYLSNKDFLSNMKVVIDFFGMYQKQQHQILEETDDFEIRKIIDTETKQIIDNAYNRAVQILSDNIDKLHAEAKVLLEKEKIDSEEFEAIFAE